MTWMVTLFKINSCEWFNFGGSASFSEMSYENALMKKEAKKGKSAKCLNLNKHIVSRPSIAFILKHEIEYFGTYNRKLKISMKSSVIRC